MSDVTPWHPLNTPHMTITNFNYEGSYLPGLICHMDVKADLGRSPGRSTSTPQMHHGRYIMGCFWQPFWILQDKVGISFYFWIIRVVNSQLAWYSHVKCNPLTPSQHPLNTPHMTITNFNYESSYLPGLICHMDVKADLGRSPGRSTPTPKCIMGYILWDVYGSHFGFFKKRWEFPFISA